MRQQLTHGAEESRRMIGCSTCHVCQVWVFHQWAPTEVSDHEQVASIDEVHVEGVVASCVGDVQAFLQHGQALRCLHAF